MSDVIKLAVGNSYRLQGVQMFMDYLPDLRGDPTIEKWTFAHSEDDPHQGYGWLEVSIHEIIETQMSGVLVCYYRQWFSPDGEALGRRTRKVSSVGSLRGLIKRRAMTPTADQAHVAEGGENHHGI